MNRPLEILKLLEDTGYLLSVCKDLIKKELIIQQGQIKHTKGDEYYSESLRTGRNRKELRF